MRRICAALLVVGVVLGASVGAVAAMTTGYGETDYEFANRRECCQAAALAAQANGASNCRARGGYATESRNIRGMCDTRTGRDGRGRAIYACTSKVSVKCR